MSGIAVSSIGERISELNGRFQAPTTEAAATPEKLFGTELARLTAAQKQAALSGLTGSNPLSGLTGSNPLSGLTGSNPLSAFGGQSLNGLAGLAGLNGLNGLAGLNGVGATGVGVPALAAAGVNAVPTTAAAGAVITSALSQLGVPYLWGGTTPNGFDCSGLVQHAYRAAGVAMPRVSQDQARMGVEVPSLDQALPGDLIAFGSPVNHIGIYLGDGKMVQAPRTGDVVKVSGISRPIATIRRVIDPNAGAFGPAGASLWGMGAMPPAGGAGGSAALAAAPGSLRALFQQAGAANGVDPGLLAAVAKVESGFNPSAVSPVGAQGIMQFMPGTAAQYGVNPFDPASAINGAARYLRSLTDEFGSTELALAAYNAGPGNVRKHGGIPPFTETQKYVTNVVKAWRSGS